MSLTLDISDELARMAAEEDLRLLVAFGSSVKSGRHPRDLDLALLPQEGWLCGHDDALWQRWAHGTGRGDLDLVWLPNAGWQLARQVALHGRALYEARAGEWNAVRASLLLRSADSDAWRAREKEFLSRLLEKNLKMDLDLTRRKAAQFGLYLEELEKVLAAERVQFDQGGLHFAAERLVELLVETAAWINTEVAQSVASIPPSDYYSSFFAMQRAGWIDGSTAQALAEMARLRNALVHHYEDVPLATLHERLSASLPHWRTHLGEVTSRL